MKLNVQNFSACRVSWWRIKGTQANSVHSTVFLAHTRSVLQVISRLEIICHREFFNSADDDCCGHLTKKAQKMAASTHKTMAELKDIVYHDMKGLYERGEAEKDIRDVLQLERSIEQEVERRNTDARSIIKGEGIIVIHTVHAPTILPWDSFIQSMSLRSALWACQVQILVARLLWKLTWVKWAVTGCRIPVKLS